GEGASEGAEVLLRVRREEAAELRVEREALGVRRGRRGGEPERALLGEQHPDAGVEREREGTRAIGDERRGREYGGDLRDVAALEGVLSSMLESERGRQDGGAEPRRAVDPHEHVRRGRRELYAPIAEEARATREGIVRGGLDGRHPLAGLQHRELGVDRAARDRETTVRCPDVDE